MNLVFIIFRYFPYGGLQQDFRRILEETIRRRHAVTVLYERWEGDFIPGAQYQQFKSNAVTNWGKAADFECKVLSFLREKHFDLTVGFNRMAGLDIYFAADNCFAGNARKKHPILHLLAPRYRVFKKMERNIFDNGNKSSILYLTESQKRDYQTIYGTEEKRFHLLPPGLSPEYHFRELELCRKIREEVRNEFHIPKNHQIMIQVCSSFLTKGLDRSLNALVHLPEPVRRQWHFLVVGRDHPKKFQKLLTAGKIMDQVRFIGERTDVWRLLYGADLMVHPARNEAAGNVLTEAISCGLPVITTACCGYAPMIADAGGIVLHEPFCQIELEQQLQSLVMVPENLTKIKQKAVVYSSKFSLQNRQSIAVDIIERAVSHV